MDALVWAGKPAAAGSLRDPLTPGVGLMPMDYFQCFSEAMCDSFAAWGRAVKEASDNRLVTGCYYGYTLAQLFTAVPGFVGHTAVDRAARTPYVDIYVSPAEYDDSRRQGGHLWGHNIPESLRLHNKLFLYESDTRTYLADIQPKQFSLRETLEVFKRDACSAILRGQAWWWFEFADGQRGANAREWFSIFFAGRAGENYYGGNELNLFINEKGQYDAKPREQWDQGDFSMAARRTFREFLLRKYGTEAALRAAWQQPQARFDDILEPARFRRDQIDRPPLPRERGAAGALA